MQTVIVQQETILIRWTANNWVADLHYFDRYYHVQSLHLERL